ncbi:MAG: type III restriction-modification system endonuclease, partial [Phascolarctobacterium sp.]|nr:type III restriction-modification system endonuclease [Candidatus Phascolarctobacterium caballi]
LTRADYDYGSEGFYRPLDGMKATHPVVMIDEPHRFDKKQKAFQTIIKDISPQVLIRYGATFPEYTTGRGSSKIIRNDYVNLLYNLNACAAFNQGLIKGVVKEHLEAISGNEEKIKITSVDSKDAVHLQYKKKHAANKSFTLKTGDSLAVISNELTGLTVKEIGTSSVVFSNGIEKHTGEEMDADICMTSYQEQMLKLALQRHFETERKNFCGRSYKIKTLALFFIDDISSYREHDGKRAYLLEKFEYLLRKQIESVLAGLDEHEQEYKDFLEASLADISACHAGYFSEDNSDSDEDIAKEVDVILHGKKELLAFRKEDGSYNTLRFLFSKWTLKEGWDNPNVFTIAKLRSSGSEISKLQEVGRGLRLPVDEYGNRIANEEFELNYIVDFTEEDFAEKLVNEINSDIPEATEVTENLLIEIARRTGKDEDDLFDELYSKHYIDRHYKIVPENRQKFLDEYPLFERGLQSGKVKDRNKVKPQRIKIRKGKYDELKDLWEEINKRYVLLYEKELDNQMQDVIYDIFANKDVFRDNLISSERERVKADETGATVVKDANVSYKINENMPYGVFLKRLSMVTNLSVKDIHLALCRYAKDKRDLTFTHQLNEKTISAFNAAFNDWKNENLQGRFHYQGTGAVARGTALTYADGKVKEDIVQGLVGTKIQEGVPCEKYLYDVIAYDSPLEKENILEDIENVIVYAKIPRRSIAIPTVGGGTYSPDFMYVVKHKDGTKELNVIVETKDVENVSDLRGEEKTKISCAKVFFESLTINGYTVHFERQVNNKKMRQIIEDVLGNAE